MYLSNFGNYKRTEYLTDNNIFLTVYIYNSTLQNFFIFNNFKNRFLHIITEFKYHMYYNFTKIEF